MSSTVINPLHRTRGWPRAKSKGSLLIVALILCAVIGIALASYLQLARTH